MENKYFTPDISDIRVGYELESHNISMDELGVPELNYDRWEKRILKQIDVGYFMKYGIRGGIRVPYLTKEQIEAEGWECIYDDGSTLNFKRPYHELTFWPEPSYNIYLKEEGTQNGYGGECKDINTFRYICKLLNI